MEGIPTNINAEYLVSSRDAGILRHIKSLAHESRGSNFDNAVLEHFTYELIGPCEISS